MSLLASTNSGSASVPYFVENIGGAANAAAAPPPCIKGGLLSSTPGVSDTTVRIGNPVSGLILTGGGGSSLPLVRGINGGTANTTGGESLLIGASVASGANIVLTDAATRINSDLTLGANATPGSGDIIFANGATGSSISGYQTAQIAVAGAGAQANPVGLTPGAYALTYVAPGAGNEPAQPSGVFVWSGTSWFGNAVSFNFTAGAPNCAICPTAGGATLTVGGAGVPAPATIFLRKLLNAA